MQADPTKAIGSCIWTTGVYEIAVSEILARLIKPGDMVVDAGANVGYMTLLASMAAGPTGRVVSFEPHPELFGIIQQNVFALRKRFDIANTELHNTALGDRPGIANLLQPSKFAINDGISRIASVTEANARTLSVNVETLDETLQEQSVSVLKLDVEGFEPQVLRGAVRLLESRSIRHIVFEDHKVEGSEVVRILKGMGYRIYSLGWSVRGITLFPVHAGTLATEYEAPNFLATIAPNEALTRCHSKGWWVLSDRLIRELSRRRKTVLA